MKRKNLVISVVLGCLLILLIGRAAVAQMPSSEPAAALFVSGLEGASGSTIGPGGALYVTENTAGRIARVDPQTGEVTTFASGLPPAIVNIGGVDVGGAMDVAFIGNTAYALVTLVGPDVGGAHEVGIYRIDGPDSSSLFANIGEFSVNNPPETQFDVPSGLQYALEAYHGGFLVTDGHHNRVLWVSVDGQVSELIAFGNIVPTGLETRGETIFMAETGPVPHRPEDGKVVAFGYHAPTPMEVAAGAPLLVDVEFGLGQTLYALSQGEFPDDGFPAVPAIPNTGALVVANGDGTFSTITNGLNRPSSLELIGNAAYVMTLSGEIWKIEGVSGPPFGVSN